MRVFSGIQPSGDLHVGNYLGAIKQWVAAQTSDAFYCIVDLHALTNPVEPEILRERTREIAAWIVAAGIDPDVSTLFVQSHVPYHAQLAWLLECVASYGELTRMTQFKEKSALQDGVRAGLLTYPVLMAADILLYDTADVPVGDDQRQHLELARNLAERFNNRYGETFQVPRAVTPASAARVMDLQDPTRKMSKSVASELGTVYLDDRADAIARKISKAVTDTDGAMVYDWDRKPGLANLLDMFAAFEGSDPRTVAARYQRYGDLKRELSELMVESLTPIAARYRALRENDALDDVLARGAAKASVVASATYARAAQAIGLTRGR